MIYFLQPIDGGPVKIGTTENVEARHKQLEATYGQPLALLATMPGGRGEETAIHARFGHLRFGRSEQFRPSLDLMEFLGRPLLVGANPEAVEAMDGKGQASVINLKGTDQYRDWLSGVSKKTRIPAASIVRLALEEWASKYGHSTPPEK